MNHSHEPDPQFLEKLEWRLESEGRRLRRLNIRSERALNWGNMKMMGIIALSIISGFFVSSTAAYIKDSSQRQLLLAKQEIRIRQIESQNKFLQQRHFGIKKRVDLGILPPGEDKVMGLNILQGEFALKKLNLDYEEIAISGRSPQDGLSAPRIGGRDFVTERLQLRRLELQEYAQYLEGKLEEIQRKVDTGVIDPYETETVKLNLKMAQLAMEGLDKKMHLRNRFNEGDVSAEQVNLLEMISEAEEKLESLEASIVHNQDRLAVIEKEFQIGLRATSDVLEAHSQLEAAKAEQQIVQIELQLLRNGLEE